jgi:hypothetical protein
MSGRAAAACVTAVACVAVVLAGAGCAPAKTPGETYLAYHGAVLQARTVEDLATFIPQGDRDKMTSAPAQAKEMVFGLRQDMEKLVVGAPKVVKEDVQGDKATVEVEAVIDYARMNSPLGQKPAGATIKLVKERDGWKVVNAPNWQMK